MREALADIEERDRIMAEIGTQFNSKIDEQCIMYYTKMNQVDGENLTNLQALLYKLEAIVHKKMGYLKKNYRNVNEIKSKLYFVWKVYEEQRIRGDDMVIRDNIFRCKHALWLNGMSDT